jgi:DNA polymerase elongation subunit (family B)
VKHTAKQITFQETLQANQQYTVVATIGSKVISRARTTDGAPVYVEQKYSPTYYIPVAAHEASQATHHGFDGTPLIPHVADSIWEAKEWIESRKSGVWGDIQCEYMVLADTYGAKDVPYDMDRLYIWNFDMETDSEGGFAKPDDPFQPITAITVVWRHMGKMGKVVYGTGAYTIKGDELYILCKTEEELLLRFLDDFRSAGDYPDILTGYNIQFYDVPYLVNRMKRLFTEDIWIRLSPFQRLADRKVILLGHSETVIDIKGIAILDYLELYRKFTLTQRESYRLDTIAHIELGRRKTSFKEVGSLRRLYREDHQKFIEYNINDTMLVDELDLKLKLIELVCSLAYGAKCNFVDCFRQVRLWDIMIYHKLRADKKQIPPRPEVHTSADQYEGAHVKDPLVGMHHWIASFDVASMYPHIIREWNLSPECKLPEMVTGLTVDALLSSAVDTSDIKKRDVCIAANGVLTDRHREGFIPEMLKSLYDERIRFKKLQEDMDIAAEKETDPDTKAAFKRKSAAYGNQQKIRKVNLNSAYGALGSAYFRFYDRDLAEAVTITGQYIIRLVAQNINAYLNHLFPGTPDKTGFEPAGSVVWAHDYIIASDTDSVYVQMEKVVGMMPTTATTVQIVKGLHNFCEKKIQPIINQTFEDIATYLNVHTSCLSMVRDVIADKALWTAKKRYIINMHVSEGKWFPKPKILVHGLESIKSSTPEIVRDMITAAFTLMMNGTEKDIWKHIEACEAKFRAGNFEDIAFPRSVNGIDKYEHKAKGLPIQVAGALAFNRAIDRTNLSTTYEKVRDGEKIKFAYLKQPNPFFTHVMAAPYGCPPEWEIEKWLDYDTQFSKTFLEPMSVILKCMGWKTKHEASLW